MDSNGIHLLAYNESLAYFSSACAGTGETQNLHELKAFQLEMRQIDRNNGNVW